MNYTKNYHLPQWVKEDRVLMEDFNAAMADIESGLTQNKAFTEAGLAKNKASADAGIAEAKAQAAELPYVIGTYSGKDEKQTIEVGFKPSFLIIAAHNANGYGFKGGIFGKTVTSSRMQFTSTGFTVSTHNDLNYYPMVNCVGYTFVYIAFR